MRNIASCGLAIALCVAACSNKDDSNKKKKPAPATKTTAEPAEKKAAEPPAPDPKLIERGAYVAGLAGCLQCHTALGPQGPALDKLGAGGFEFPEVFGTWRSPNITPDKKTGIGDWTDAQIIALLRTGKRPDGTQVYPIMPYMYYAAMSDDDANALVAFLRTLPPVENAVEGNTDLKLPKPPAPPATGKAPPQDDPVKYGEYLATLMHCHMCHTPMTEKGPDMSKSFAGGFKFEIPAQFEPMLGKGYLVSPNITPHEKNGVGGHTDEQLMAAVRELKKKDGSPIFGPMGMYAGTWSKVTDDDAKAIVAYLRSLPPNDTKPEASKFTPPAGPPPGAPK
jgi:mono/diheme cytochrome c family protein